MQPTRQLCRFTSGAAVRAAAFSISGSQLPAVPALGFAPPPMPEFSLSGELQQESGRWAVREFDLPPPFARIYDSHTIVMQFEAARHLAQNFESGRRMPSNVL